LLLSVGKAKVEAKDYLGETALLMAVHEGHIEAVEVLLSVGKANVEAADNCGDTALLTAADGGHREIVMMLLSAGANADAKNKGGLTARDYALTCRENDLADLLAKYEEGT
jgi:ankyrin repeat protein